MAAKTVSPFTRQRAQVLAYNGHLWSRGTSKRTGERFYLIPSTTDPEHVAYYATASGCTCPGFRNRGACIHSEAVAQFEARQRANELRRAIFGPTCDVPGCDNDPEKLAGGLCYRHRVERAEIEAGAALGLVEAF